jgi:hypothetical protein
MLAQRTMDRKYGAALALRQDGSHFRCRSTARIWWQFDARYLIDHRVNPQRGSHYSVLATLPSAQLFSSAARPYQVPSQERLVQHCCIVIWLTDDWMTG